MRPRRVPAASGETYGGTLFDRLSSLHGKFGQVPIETLNAVPVLKSDRPAIPILPARECDDASRRRSDRCSGASADIYAGVNVAPSAQRAPRSETGTDRSTHRPVHSQCGERVGGVASDGGFFRRAPSTERNARHDRRNTYDPPARQPCNVHNRRDGKSNASEARGR